VSGSGISWAICKSSPRSRQITTLATHHYRPDALPMPFLSPNQQRQSTEGICCIIQCKFRILIDFWSIVPQCDTFYPPHICWYTPDACHFSCKQFSLVSYLMRVVGFWSISASQFGHCLWFLAVCWVYCYQCAIQLFLFTARWAFLVLYI